MAAFGTLFLNRLESPGADGPATAVGVTLLAMAGTAILGALAGSRRRRPN